LTTSVDFLPALRSLTPSAISSHDLRADFTFLILIILLANDNIRFHFLNLLRFLAQLRATLPATRAAHHTPVVAVSAITANVNAISSTIILPNSHTNFAFSSLRLKTPYHLISL
jgi:hypothetical protein